MRRRSLFLLAASLLPGLASATAFSGRWALDARLSSLPPVAVETPLPDDEARMRRPSRDAGSADIPLEAIVKADLLVVEDDGAALRVTYPSGRKRVFRTDGTERALDDGDGLANVTARRKGDVVRVVSAWPRSYTLHETWEVRGGRLHVSGKASGRRTLRYERVYEPAPPPTPTPVPTAAPTPAPGTTPAASAAGPAVSAAGFGACSVRPPKRTGREALAAMAKLTARAAEEKAIAAAAPKKVDSVISSDLEVQEGCLVWPFDLRLAGGGILEVAVDAGDGKVLFAGAPRD